MRVAIFPVDRTFWSETYLAPGRFIFSWAGANGTVTFPPVPAGDYYAVEMAAGEELMSAERMAEWAKRATTVRLKTGEKTTVALRR